MRASGRDGPKVRHHSLAAAQPIVHDCMLMVDRASSRFRFNLHKRDPGAKQVASVVVHAKPGKSAGFLAPGKAGIQRAATPMLDFELAWVTNPAKARCEPSARL